MTLEPWLLSLIIVWILIIVVLALVILRALHRQRHIRHAYIRAMEQHAIERAARLQNDALLYHPTMSPRGLTKEEVDIAAPLSVTIPDAVFLDEEASMAMATANLPPAPSSNPPHDISMSFPTISSLAFSEMTYEPVTCSICLEDIAVGERKRVIKRCGHAYHSKCIRNWLRRENKCPNCQQEALEKARHEQVEMQIVARVRHLRTVEQPRRPFALHFLNFLARKRTHRSSTTHVAASNAHGGARISFERRARGRSGGMEGNENRLQVAAPGAFWTDPRIASRDLDHDLEVDVESGLVGENESSSDQVEVLTRMNTV